MQRKAADGKEAGLQAFSQRKTPLPQLSMQDIKVMMAGQGDKPQTKLLMQVPLNYDIMCAQGVRDWQSQRGVTIEQCDIMTITSDTLGIPKSRTIVQQINHFEGLDSKVREIEECVELMERDLDDLDIPQPSEPVVVEKLFSANHARKPVKLDDTEDNSALQTSFKREVLPKTTITMKASTSTDRAREKVKLAQRTIQGGFGTTVFDSKKNEKKSEVRHHPGKINWIRINELMQDEEF